MATEIADWIEFGQVSAERDEFLSEYFFENGVLGAVVKNHHHFLILGRKGAGKTAVFTHFDQNSQNYLLETDLLTSLSLQNYSWDIHNLLASEGKAPSLAYIQSWKYIIYLTAVRMLPNDNGSKKLRAAKKLISRVYKSPAPTITEVISSKLLQLTKFRLPKAGLDFEDLDKFSVSAEGGEITFSEIKKDHELLDRLNSSIERMSDLLEEALLEALSDKMRIFITFDRIDEAWDASSFESSQKIITGLIGAAETISSKFKERLRPIIFLREDIFDSIDLNDKNKLRADCGQLLVWSKAGLERMLLERINFFAHRAGQADFASIADIFDREQMRQTRAPFDHIMLRTMVRPRDFIRMLQLVKSDMKDRVENPYEKETVNSNKLECQSIYNAEPAYSEWLLEEIKDEWRVQYPKIIDLLTALQNHGLTTLSSYDLEQALRRTGAIIAPGDVNSYLRFLFDNSVLGFKVGMSQQWKFKCFFKTQGFVESDTYKVHDGLHKGLNLTESRKSA